MINILKFKRKYKIIRAKRTLKINNFTIISQNCIGGVFYHDMGLKFLSPTINLYFEAGDFLKFVKRLKYYLKVDLKIMMGDLYPIGKLDDIKIHFMHYSNCKEAYECWERRKKRVNMKNIIVIATDRDGFNNEIFQQFKDIRYKKILFTCNKKWLKYDFCVRVKGIGGKCVHEDMVINREFYNRNYIVKKLNSDLN